MRREGSLLRKAVSADRGSDLIITTNSFNNSLSLWVDDEDLIPDDHTELQARDDYTDTTLSLVCREVYDVERRLNCVPAREL